MLPRVNPTTTKSWQLLQQHYNAMQQLHMRDLFKNDSQRFSKFSIKGGDILFDYSKNIITEETIQLLLQLANECHLPNAIEAMFNGDIINETERRAVLHTALRNFSERPVYSEGTNVMPAVKKVLQQMKDFCSKVHSGAMKSHGINGVP